MGFIINLIFLFFYGFSLIESSVTYINNKGITDITYDNTGTEKTTSFKIRLEQASSGTHLTLLLSYPYKSNRDPCEANCDIVSDAEGSFYDCTITETNCDLLNDNKRIIIESIKPPTSYSFSNIETLTSLITFELTDIDMVCSNYKLSFWLTDNNLQHRPYDNLEFSFPVYYRDNKEAAECIFPKYGNSIPCVIDASKRLFEKGYFINFEYNKTIALTNDLTLILKLNKYTLEDDCGININKGKMIYFKIYNSFYIFLLLILFF